MKLLVCISLVPNTETNIKLLPGGNSIDLSEIDWIMNPWDELGLTRAVELKKQNQSIIESVTVITVGKSEAQPALKKALAIGADKAIRIDAPPPDSWFVAKQISEIILRDSYDIVITGIESSDFNSYAVGGMLAELTSYACIPNVSSIEINHHRVFVQREIEGGKERLEAEVPFIAVIQKGVTSAPGIPSMRGIMEAKNKTIEIVDPVDAESFLEYTEYTIPETKKKCTIITGYNFNELIENLHIELQND